MNRPARRPIPRELLVLAALGIYFLLMLAFDRSLFAPRPGRVVDDLDGFQQTILAFVDDPWGDDFAFWLLARFLVIYPLYALEKLPLATLTQAMYLLVYSIPIALWTPQGSRPKAAQLVLLLVPVFISFRLAISIYAVSYCLIFMVDRKASPALLLWYAFALFLSSSTMFIFLLYFPLIAWRRLRDRGPGWRFAFVLMYLAISSQFIGKIYDLFERSISGEVLSTAGAAGLDYSGSTLGFLAALSTGNPFFTAIVAGQYERLLILLPSVFIAAIAVRRLWRSENRQVLPFVGILLASMLSEGVGSYAVGIVLFLIFIHARAVLGPSRKPRTQRPVRRPQISTR